MQESVPVRSNWRSTLFSLIAMGIFDDAIRQHLDLKRQHGAAESELKHLEDEAFGPPSRPGEPDFPEIRGRGGACGKRKRKRVGRRRRRVRRGSRGVERGSPGTEAPVAEHPIVDEAPEPAESETRGSEEPTTFYDQTPDEEDASAEPEAAGDPPVESLDTVEHPPPFDVIEAEPASAEPEVAPEPDEGHSGPSSPRSSSRVRSPRGMRSPPTTRSPRRRMEEPADEDADDVLADTPEFLKDAPEDDELWFEQGKPKDFDF